MSKLSNTIKEMALEANACGKVMDSWTDDMSYDAMVRLFVEQSNFCLSEGVPSIEFIRTHFDKELLHAHNIYIDESVDGVEVNGKAIVLGECFGDMLVLPWKVADIQIKDCTQVKVLCGKLSDVHIGMFGKSEVCVDAYTLGTIAYVHMYSDDAVVSSIGDVRQRRVTLKDNH